MQGDYIDDAGLGLGSGFGTDSGLASGRHVRYNYNNYTKVCRLPRPRKLNSVLNYYAPIQLHLPPYSARDLSIVSSYLTRTITN